MEGTITTKPKLSYAALSTILAALRSFQEIPQSDRSEGEHFLDCKPLSDDEIDDLCEELNCGMFDITDAPDSGCPAKGTDPKKGDD